MHATLKLIRPTERRCMQTCTDTRYVLLFIPSFCPSVTSMLTVKTARLNVSLNCLHHPDLVALAVNSFLQHTFCVISTVNSQRGPSVTGRVNVSNFSSFYRAMLCIRGICYGPVSVCLSVCPSQVGVLLKRLNIESYKQHRTIPQGL